MLLRNKCILFVLVLFICSLSSGCGGLIGLFEELNQPLSTNKIRASESTLKIDIPFELKDLPLDNIDVFSEALTDYANKFGTSKHNALALRIMFFSFDEDKAEEMTGEPFYIDLEGGAAGVLEDIKRLPNAINVKQENIEKIKVDGHNAIKMEISYDYKEKNETHKIVVNEYIIEKGSDVWFICFQNAKNDFFADSLSEKIFKSIEIR